MGAGLSFWIFFFSLFPNPIIENSKVGFINSNGDTYISPNHYSFFAKEALTLENFININKETIRNSYAFTRSEHGKAGFITEDADSLIILGKNGELFESFSLKGDTLQLYYYLDKENSAATKIKYFMGLQAAKELYSSDKKTINIGLKDNKDNVIQPHLYELKGLREYFRFNNSRKEVRLLGNELIFTGQNIIDFEGNIILETNRVDFSENQEYIICSNDEKETVINLEGEVIAHSKSNTLESVSHTMFAVKNAKATFDLLNIQGDTLISSFDGISDLRDQYSLHDRYELGNTDIVPVLTVKMMNKKYGLINNNEEWIQLPNELDSLYPIAIQNPQSDLYIIKNGSSRIVQEAVINKKGKFVYKPRKEVSISPVSGQWVHIHDRNNNSLAYFLNLVNGEKIDETKSDKSYKIVVVSNEKYIIDYETFIRPDKYQKVRIYKLSEGEMKHIDSKSNLFVPHNSNHEIFIVEANKTCFLYNIAKSKNVSEAFGHLTFGTVSFLDLKKQIFVATKKGKKGIVDENGKWLIKPMYHEILPFRGELALAQIDSTSFQYINKEGETVWKLPETDKTAWNKEAFLESFKNCEPSIFMQKQGYTTVYQYEIKQGAAEGGGCVVESRFLLNKNLKWIDKTMTCTYDNSLPFKEAIQPCLPDGDENKCDCEGELWDIMSNHK